MQAPVPPLTDTSLKMNQLAAKYLKKDAFTTNTPSPKPVDMSLATRNYMEKHKIIQQGMQAIKKYIRKFIRNTVLHSVYLHSLTCPNWWHS